MARFRTGINTRNACIAQAWVQSASKHHHTHAFIVKWFSNVINCKALNFFSTFINKITSKADREEVWKKSTTDTVGCELFRRLN